MVKIWVEFQREPLKFHTKYINYILKDIYFDAKLKFYDLLDVRAHKCFWNAPYVNIFP